MSLVLVDWLNENENRAYPVNEEASRLSLAGVELPDNIIVDANLAIPRSAGRFITLSSLSISANLVTLTLVASENSICGAPSSSSSSGAPEFTPIASLSVVRPVTRFKNYQVQPLYPGVAGWIALGQGAVDIANLVMLFGGPAAAQLVDRAVRVYDDIPALSLGKVGVALALTGIVRLKGATGLIKTSKGQRIINGRLRDVGIIELDTSVNPTTVLQQYAGPCGGRPEVGTCNSPPITRISGVAPDCNGNIDIEFEGEQLIGDVGDGMIVDFPIGLQAICPKTFKLTENTKDVCGSSLTSSSSTPEPSSSSFSSSSHKPPSPSYCENFSGGRGELTPIIGSWNIPAGIVPLECNIGYPGEQFCIDKKRSMDLKVIGDTYVVEGTMQPLISTGEAHLITAFGNRYNFYFVGVSLTPVPGYPNGYFFIGKRSGITGPISLPGDVGYNLLARFDPGVVSPLVQEPYRFIVLMNRLTSGLITIQFKVEWGIHTLVPLAFSVAEGTVAQEGWAGLGTVLSPAAFNQFGINCTGSSSSL
jgi:hypothetical protein